MNKYIIQLIATIILTIPNFLIGFSVSWPSYTLTTLQSDQSPFREKITSSEANLIGSIPMVGGFVANVVVGYLIEFLGRKGTDIIAGLLITVSLVIIAIAANATLLLVGRFAFGVGTGLHGAVGLVYITEMCEVSIRGTLSSLAMFLYCFGGLVSFIMGWLCTYEVINYTTVTLSVVFLVLLSWLKESPIFLLRKGQEKEALKSLLFYRGVRSVDIPQTVLQEFTELKNQRDATPELETSPIEAENEKLQEKQKTSLKGNETTEGLSPWKILYKVIFHLLLLLIGQDYYFGLQPIIFVGGLLVTSKADIRALVTVSIHVCITAMMGTAAVQTYAGQFFTKAVPDISPHLCSIALAVIVTVASLISMVVSDMIGRRVLMISMTAAASVLLILLASMLHWSWAPSWAVPVVVLLFSFLFQIGPGCVPVVQLSECFRPQVKGISMTISICTISVTYFILLLFFGPVVEAAGLDGTFLIFGIFGCITTTIAALIMKETRRVPLSEITAMFEKGYLCRYPSKKI